METLDNPAARNATLELGGAEALSPRQVVRIFEESGGRPFEVAYVPVEALQEQRKAATDRDAGVLRGPDAVLRSG